MTTHLIVFGHVQLNNLLRPIASNILVYSIVCLFGAILCSNALNELMTLPNWLEKDFMAMVGKRLEKCPMEIRYAYQELDKLPEGYTAPADRVKPWGTCHAVLCAKDVIDGAPMAVINADDYYGKAAFRAIYDHLCNAEDCDV